MAAARYRELTEELGAGTADASQVFLFSSPSDAGVAVQHFFEALLTSLDESARSGSELNDPSLGDELASVDLKPTALKELSWPTGKRYWSKRASLLVLVTRDQPFQLCQKGVRLSPAARMAFLSVLGRTSVSARRPTGSQWNSR